MTIFPTQASAHSFNGIRGNEIPCNYGQLRIEDSACFLHLQWLTFRSYGLALSISRFHLSHLVNGNRDERQAINKDKEKLSAAYRVHYSRPTGIKVAATC